MPSNVYQFKPKKERPILKGAMFFGIFIALGALIQVVGLGGKPEGDSPASALMNQPAPDMTIKLNDGGAVQLSSLKGNVVVLDFWAVWCGPCKRALPMLSELATTYRNKGVNVYLVGDGDEQEKAYLKENNINATGASCDDDALRSYHVQGIPQTVIVDQSGVVRLVKVGYSSNEKHELQETIDKALEKGAGD